MLLLPNPIHYKSFFHAHSRKNALHFKAALLRVHFNPYHVSHASYFSKLARLFITSSVLRPPIFIHLLPFPLTHFRQLLLRVLISYSIWTTFSWWTSCQIRQEKVSSTFLFWTISHRSIVLLDSNVTQQPLDCRRINNTCFLAAPSLSQSLAWIDLPQEIRFNRSTDPFIQIQHHIETRLASWRTQQTSWAPASSSLFPRLPSQPAATQFASVMTLTRGDD